MTQRFTIPGRLPGMNEIIAAAKQHHQVYAKEKKALTHKAMVLARAAGLRRVQRPCCVRFNWFEENKRRDQDNICAGAKFILDGLQDAGILPTDGWQGINGLEHRFYVDKENPRIEVELMGEPA
jgi:hypothetical protein